MLFLSWLGSGFAEVILGLVALIMAVLVAIPFHEFAHAYAAKLEGDYTATACKRCTLNGLAHMDFAGFLLMALFGFGWAKPVPIDERNFKRGNRSKFIVSIAGILMNLLLGTAFLFIYMIIYRFFPEFYVSSLYGYLLQMFLEFSFFLNFGLAIFNILPIYPLDGYNIIASFSKTENGFLRFMKQFSFVFFAIIIFTNLYDIYYNVVIGAIFDVLVKFFSFILGF